MKTVNLDNRDEFYGSDSLLEDAKSKNSECYVNVAFTDYGGSFFDKVLIEYFENNFSKNIVSELTSWGGKNAFIFGDLAIELITETNNYLLGFRDLEDFYSQKEIDEYENAANEFIKYNSKYLEYKDAIIDYFYECARMETFGVDYCESDLKEYLDKIIND